MTNTKRILRLWTILSVIILMFPIIFYISKFFSPHLSDDLIDWSNFSVFFSNILNPILLCINIYLLIKLSYEVANYNEKNIRNEMRHQAYVDISNKLYSFAIIIQNSENRQRDLGLLRIDIVSFSSTMDHLFQISNLEQLIDEIETSLYEVSESDYIKNDLMASRDSDEFKNFNSLCEIFDRNRVNFIKTLQKLII
jgi:hypothetical protein